MPTTSPTRATRWTFDPTLAASRALTVAAELDAAPARLAQLRATLASINDDLVGENAGKRQPKLAGGVPVKNTTFRPDQLPDTHFMRCTSFAGRKAYPPGSNSFSTDPI